MKNASSFFAMTMILILGFQISLNAQRKATWKGGSPGRSADWNCPTNWKEGYVPDGFSNVIIPDVSSGSGIKPVIYSAVEPVNSLVLYSGAQLKIEQSGALEVIDIAETFASSSILNKGKLKVPKDNPYLKINYDFSEGNFATR